MSFKPTASVSNEAEHEYAGGQADRENPEQERESQNGAAAQALAANGAGDGDNGGGGADGAGSDSSAGGAAGAGGGNGSGDDGNGTQGLQFGLGGYSLSGPPIQAKLRVSQSDDPQEREADQVANAIVSGGPVAKPGQAQPAITPRPGAGQVLRRAAGPAAIAKSGGEVGGASEARIRGLSGGGSPLPETERSFFESKMGHDFGGVRVHNGAEAASATSSINARAFTRGNDIAFAPGQYQPESIEGRKLLAHELTHVVQQGGAGAASSAGQANVNGGASTISRKVDGDVVQREPDGGDAAGDNATGDSDSQAGDGVGGDADAGDQAVSPEQDLLVEQLMELIQSQGPDSPAVRKFLGDLKPDVAETIQKKALAKAGSTDGRSQITSDTTAKDSTDTAHGDADQTTVPTTASPVDAAQNTITTAVAQKPEPVVKSATQATPKNNAAPKDDTPDPQADSADGIEVDGVADPVTLETGGAGDPGEPSPDGPPEGGDAPTADPTGPATPGEGTSAAGSDTSGVPVGGGSSGGGPGAGGGPPAAPIAKSLPAVAIGGDPGQILDQLSGVPATQAADAFNQAKGASGAALKGQRDQEQRDIPKIVPSTGMPAGEQPVKPKLDLKSQSIPDSFRGQKTGRGKAPINTNTIIPKTKNIDTKLKTDTRIDRGGDADPRQIDSAKTHSDQIARTQSRDAHKKTFLDFGESKIQPAPREPDPCDPKPLKEPTPGSIAGAQQDPVPAAIQGPLNQSLTPALNQQIGQKSQEYTIEEQKFREQKAAARADSDTKIAAAKKEQTQKQLEHREQASKQTEKFKADWRGENEQAQKEYDDKVAKASSEQKGKIRSEQSKGERKALEHVRKAEKDAAEKKRSADEEAQAKSKEPEKQGVFAWLADRAKAFIDGIKKAINAIYDGLRSAVKFVFDAAKQLIKGVLEAARFAIVTLIKGYALLLKGYLRILGVFFPKTCEKYTALIDQAVQFAVKAVNAVVDFLKTVYCGILDFLAETIDALLGLIQDIYNGLLTLIGLIISGKFAEIIEGLANLYAAAKKSPLFFQQALMEELLGGNLSDPLSPAEVAWAYQNNVPGLPPKDGGAQTDQAGGDGAGGQGGPDVEGDAEGGPKPPYTNKNVLVEPVLQNETLHPDLMQEVIQRLGGGDGSFEFGHSDEPSRSIDSILQENRGQQNSAANAPAPANDQAKQPEDGLTPIMRGKIRWEMMKDSLAQWWDKNWPWILAAAVGVLAVGVAAIILSGGAILGIIPPLMAALAPIFVGMTIATIAKPLTSFVKLAWGGEIDGGAHQLAKAGAAGTIEAVTWLTFKTGTLAVRATKATVKGAIRAARTTLRLAKLASRSGRAFVRGAKVVMRGLQKSALRGVRRLRVLGRQLARRLRFRKFRIRIEGVRFTIEGFINPWVILANGRIKKVSFEGSGGRKVGEKAILRIAGKRRTGIVVGGRTVSGGADPEVIKRLKRLPPAERRALFKKLNKRGLTDSDRLSILYERNIVVLGRSVTPQATLRMLNENVAFAKYIQMLKSFKRLTGISSPAFKVNDSALESILASMRTGGRRLADVGGELKKGFRDRVIDAITKGVDPKKSLELLKKITANLDNADKGSITSHWLQRVDSSLKGSVAERVISKRVAPFLRKAVRRIDFFNKSTGVGVELKSGFSKIDRDQLEDYLLLIRGRIPIDGAKFNRIKYVFTDHRGLQSSSEIIEEFLKQPINKGKLSVEVFLPNGNKVSITNIAELKKILATLPP